MMTSSKVSILIFILSFWLPQVHGASKMMLLDFDNVRNLEVDELNNIRKSTIEILVYAKKFNLVLAKVDKKTLAGKHTWYEVKIEIKKINSFESDLKFSLIEMPSGYVINRVIESKVTNLKLQYRARINILKLIFGKNVNEETGEVLNDEIIDLNTYLDEKDERKPIPLKPKDKNETPELDENNDPENEPEPEVEPEKPIPPAEEIRKEVKIKKLPRDYPVTISQFESPNLNLTKEAIPPSGKKSTINKYTFKYSVGFEKEYIESTNQFISNEQVELAIHLDRVVANMEMIVTPEDPDTNYTFNILLSKNVGENEYGVSPKYLLGSSYNYKLFEEYFSISAHAEYEKNGYINIRNRGAGIEKIDSNLLWMGVGAKISFNLFGAEIKANGRLMKTFVANSDLGVDKSTIQMDGSKYQFALETKVYKKIGIEFAYENINVTSMILSKIDTNHSVATVKLVYN